MGSSPPHLPIHDKPPPLLPILFQDGSSPASIGLNLGFQTLIPLTRE